MPKPKRKPAPKTRPEAKRRGAQPRNANARTHGFYRKTHNPGEAPASAGGIEDVIADVRQRQAQLTAYIDKHMATDNATLDDVVKLFQLHGQNASRLGRLLRDQRALTGEAADGISGAIAAALDELGTEWGVEL